MTSESIDLKARRLLCAAYLYYEHDVSIITDATFDALCGAAADELEWIAEMGDNTIDPVRVFQLGSAEEIRASAFHIKVTWSTVGAALLWYKQRWPKRQGLSDTKGLDTWKRPPEFPEVKMRKLVT